LIVMPANATGWYWHTLARETGMIGHLFSPGAQRGPWPWFPYALDNGAFAYWDMATNAFDVERFEREGLPEWHALLDWARANTQAPRWAIVPDVPGNWEATQERWSRFAPEARGFHLAVAVQDGATDVDVLRLEPAPSMICVGGTTEWKWRTVRYWAERFPRVHVLRVNAPGRLEWLQDLGVESCDGTGWNRGDRNQTKGLHDFCHLHGSPIKAPTWPFVCRDRAVKGSGQEALI
jgi:hypothetical protein